MTVSLKRLKSFVIKLPKKVLNLIDYTPLIKQSIPINKSQFKITPAEYQEIKGNLKQALKTEAEASQMTGFDKELVSTIKSKTSYYNRNNVTRTQAYLDFYNKHPEIHWALLAHMVSRNGGWNMTDLKGNLISPFLTSKQKEHFFSFLERSNALIFHDAYPQLLLYEESKKRKENLFQLLPYFHVSSFMKVIWDHFLINSNSQILTTGLIINEQNYIQTRVIENKTFQDQVLSSLSFKAQELFQYSMVMFPYYSINNEVKIAGVSVEEFSDLEERIRIGKELYSILFGVHEVYEGAYKFAIDHVHSGSRSDFWPHTFTEKDVDDLGNVHIDELCSKKTEPMLFSPRLAQAWTDKTHSYDDYSDWFTTMEILPLFKKEISIHSYDMAGEYCASLMGLLAINLGLNKLKE